MKKISEIYMAVTTALFSVTVIRVTFSYGSLNPPQITYKSFMTLCVCAFFWEKGPQLSLDSPEAHPSPGFLVAPVFLFSCSLLLVYKQTQALPGVCRCVLRGLQLSSKPPFPGMSIMLEDLGTDMMLKKICYTTEGNVSMTDFPAVWGLWLPFLGPGVSGLLLGAV